MRDWAQMLDEVNKISDLPEDITKEINILKDAPQKFIDEVIKLENISDSKKRAAEAIKYTEENNSIKSIAYPELITLLSNYESCSLSTWRQLYLLERSIPARNSKKSWLDRLKTFADTYTLEQAILGKTLDSLPGKILFARNSGDHNNLCIEQGNYSADFYCWDSTKNKLHAFVEFKHWSSDNIETAKTYYLDKRYGARYVLVFLSNHKYKLIDYETNTIIEQPNLPVLEKLLIW